MFTSLRKRPDNVTDEQLIQKFKLMMHFQGSGTSTDKDYKEFHDVCELIKIISRCTFNFSHKKKILETNNEIVNFLMERLAPKCSDILERCSWKGSLWRCDSLFQMINTTQGVCCSFNNYAFPQPNYDPKLLASIPREPRRVTACGYQTGLSLLLRPSAEDYLGTEIASSGFRVRTNYMIRNYPLQKALKAL